MSTFLLAILWETKSNIPIDCASTLLVSEIAPPSWNRQKGSVTYWTQSSKVLHQVYPTSSSLSMQGWGRQKAREEVKLQHSFKKNRNILAGWFCPRTYGVSVNMFIWAVVFWMLDWGWSFCLPGGSHTSLLKLDLVVGRRSQCSPPLHRTAVSSQAMAPEPTGGSWLSLTRSRIIQQTLVTQEAKMLPCLFSTLFFSHTGQQIHQLKKLHLSKRPRGKSSLWVNHPCSLLPRIPPLGVFISI